jgi:hypothetical protein
MDNKNIVETRLVETETETETKSENQTEIIELGKSTKLSDVTLMYENKNKTTQTDFKVHSQDIANSCEYFKTLCESDDQFHEMELPDFIMKRTSIDEFHQFLQLIYCHNSVAFTGENIIPILHCVHYFDCEQIETDSSKYLIEIIENNKLPSNLTLMQILSTADTYKLTSIISACMTALLSKNNASAWFEAKKHETFDRFFSSLSVSTRNVTIETMERAVQVTTKLIRNCSQVYS